MIKIIFFGIFNTLAAPFYWVARCILINSGEYAKFTFYLRSGASFNVYASDVKLSGGDENGRWTTVEWKCLNKRILSVNPTEIDAVTYE
jgi:hypothetical protein